MVAAGVRSMKSQWTPIGKMRRKIMIQSLDGTPTADGATADTATLEMTTWASIEPLRGNEAWLAGQQQDLVTHRIRMRYRNDVTAKMRAVYGGRHFNFVSVRNIDEIGRELEIMAVEVT